MAKTYEDQADKRMYETFRDQHGRFWGANIETKTGDPCEVLKMQDITAPVTPAWAKGLLTPPEDVVQMVPRHERAKRGYQVFVNYKLWLEKWDARHLEHLKKLDDFARGMGKEASAAEIARLLENPTEELKRITGRSPYERIPRAFILAAAANNKWATGQSNAIPARAEALLEEIKPILAMAKDRLTDLGIDPLDDGDDDEEGGEFAPAAFADPLGENSNIGDIVTGTPLEQLEEQYNPNNDGNQGGRPIPVVGKGQLKAKDKKKPALAGAKAD